VLDLNDSPLKPTQFTTELSEKCIVGFLLVAASQFAQEPIQSAQLWHRASRRQTQVDEFPDQALVHASSGPTARSTAAHNSPLASSARADSMSVWK
jgi:hypothetical protein